MVRMCGKANDHNLSSLRGGKRPDTAGTMSASLEISHNHAVRHGIITAGISSLSLTLAEQQQKEQKDDVYVDVYSRVKVPSVSL